MPIQVVIPQPNGTSPAYHVVKGVGFNVDQGYASAQIKSWMDEAHMQDGSPAVVDWSQDISPLLAQPAPAPSGAFGPQIISTIEQFLIANVSAFASGQQV